jgi:hypothetical protein
MSPSIILLSLAVGIETNPFVFFDSPSLDLSASCEKQIPIVSIVFRPGVTLLSEVHNNFLTGGFAGYEAYGPSIRAGVCLGIFTKPETRLYTEFYSSVLGFRYVSSYGGLYEGPWRWSQSIGGQAGIGLRLSGRHEMVFFGRLRTPLIWGSDGRPVFPSSLWSISLGYYFHFSTHWESSP